jgi:hypothetical protein
MRSRQRRVGGHIGAIPNLSRRILLLQCTEMGLVKTHKGRWPEKARIVGVLLFAAVFGITFVKTYVTTGVFNHGNMFNNNEVGEKWGEVCGALASLGYLDATKKRTAAERASERNNISRRIRDWMEKLMQRRSVADRPRKSTKKSRLDPILSEMHEILLAGYMRDPDDENTEVRIYSSLKHATAVNARCAQQFHWSLCGIGTAYSMLCDSHHLTDYLSISIALHLGVQAASWCLQVCTVGE